MSKRFFAFGCSCTHYKWMTWADIVAYHLNRRGYKCYNFGKPGIGNVGIFYNMMLADIKYTFNEDDTIMVVWTSWPREDRIIKTKDVWKNSQAATDKMQWSNFGTVLNNHFYSNEFVEKYWSLENDFVQNIFSITAARKLFKLAFEGSIDIVEGFNYIEASLEPVPTDKHYLGKFIVNDMIKPGHRLHFDNHNKTNNTDLNIHNKDGHPQTLDYLDYVKNVIQPATQLKLTDSITDKFAEKHWESQRKLSCNDDIDIMLFTDKQRENFLADKSNIWGDDRMSEFQDSMHLIIEYFIENYNKN